MPGERGSAGLPGLKGDRVSTNDIRAHLMYTKQTAQSGMHRPIAHLTSRTVCVRLMAWTFSTN